MMLAKKEENNGDMFLNLDRALVLQETKSFNAIPLKVMACTNALLKLLYLLYHGESLNTKDATTAFFSIIKAFQSKDQSLRRLVYVAIKELASSAEDVMMVISSLSQDMVNIPTSKSAALRALSSVIDPTMISGIERNVKQAILDNNPAVCSAALVSSIHLFFENKDAVKRWLSEIQSALQIVPPSSLSTYHATGLIALLKQDDKIALNKLISQLQTQSCHPLASHLCLRIYESLLICDYNTRVNPVDLKSFLRFKGKNDMIVLEAARIICANYEIYPSDVSFAVSSLQSFLSSKNSVLKFAAMRILHSLASYSKDLVSVCNSEIESLISDSNRNIATLAIATLLHTGNEAAVDRLIKQISDYVGEITDEFKLIIVDAVFSLGLKFPNKFKPMLTFLGNILREEGGLPYKEKAVDAVVQIMRKVPNSREFAFPILCEFIEDCEYPSLAAKILQVFGEEGSLNTSPTNLTRYIYNRLILEGSEVRLAAVGALGKLGSRCVSLREGILSLLRSFAIHDDDDFVRDRAIITLNALTDEHCTNDLFGTSVHYDLSAMEALLSKSVETGCEFNIDSVPLVSEEALFNEVAGGALLGQIDQKDLDEAIVPSALNEEIISLGEPLNFCREVSLTDSESECAVTMKKYIFENMVVLHFNCSNTVQDLLIENVSINLSLKESNCKITIENVGPISSIPFSEQKSLIVKIHLPAKVYPEIVLSPTLCFSAREGDLSSNRMFDQSTTVDYKIRDIHISFGDFFIYNPSSMFASEWARLNKSFIENLELPSISSRSEALRMLLSIFGLRSSEHYKVEEDGNISSLLFSGKIISGNNKLDIAINARLADRSGVLMELQAKAASSEAFELIVGLL